MRRRVLLVSALLVATAVGACSPGAHPSSPSAPAGWRSIAPPPGPLPFGKPLWVADELVLLALDGAPSYAYRPRDDSWRTVAPLPHANAAIGWTLVATDKELAAVARTETAVYTPRTNAWRTLPAPPAPEVFVDDQKWSPSLAWTGREVVLAQPYGDDMHALDLADGRWRRLPRTGVGTDHMHRLLPTDAGLVDVVNDTDASSPVHLLAPGATRWRTLPDFPPATSRFVPAGDVIFAGGLRPGTNIHDRGRYHLPSGTWEPLPPAPVWTGGEATSVDGGLIALWYGTATDRPERPNGALLRPGRAEWEAIPPPPERIWGGELVAAGEDLILTETQVGSPPVKRLVALFHPPSTPAAVNPAPAPPAGTCPATAITAMTAGNELTRGQRYIVYLANRTDAPCTLTGPVEVTATDAGGAAVPIAGAVSAGAGATVTAVPDFRRGASLTVEMRWSFGAGPPMVAPECRDAPRATHLFVSWPNAGGVVPITAPADAQPLLLCHVEVSAFNDAWPSW